MATMLKQNNELHDKQPNETEKTITISNHKKSELNENQLTALIKRVSRDSVRRGVTNF